MWTESELTTSLFLSISRLDTWPWMLLRWPWSSLCPVTIFLACVRNSDGFSALIPSYRNNINLSVLTPTCNLLLINNFFYRPLILLLMSLSELTSFILCFSRDTPSFCSPDICTSRCMALALSCSCLCWNSIKNSLTSTTRLHRKQSVSFKTKL